MKITIIAILYIILLPVANAGAIESLQANNMEVDLGQGASGTISFDQLSIERETESDLLNDATMDITWQGNRLHLENETDEVQLPFIKQTANNNSNQYYVDNMNMSYQMGKQVKLNFEKAHITINNSLYAIKQFSLVCKKVYNTAVASTFERCLTDKMTAKMSTLILSELTVNRLIQTLALPIQPNSASDSRNSLRKSTLTIKKNIWRLETVFDGNSVYARGTIRYHDKSHQLRINISEATTTFIFPIDVTNRIYKKLYDLDSKFVSVAPNNGTITINLSHF